MAWANGNIRWQLSFSSLRETNCRIDIYKRGYTGATVTQLIGEASPVKWDEDKSENLLDVVRAKTGYINLKEETFGALRELYPDTDIDHYIEVFYDNVCVFSGFLQAQNFRNDWVAAPRKVNIPIQSPLSIASGIHFDAISNVTAYESLGSILKKAIGKIDANITQVIFPTSISLGNNISADLTWLAWQLIYSPFNPDYDIYEEHVQSLYSPTDVKTFIEGLCNCFGLIAHDWPGMLVFQKVDFSGTYGVYNVSTLDGSTLTPAETIDGSVVNNYNNIPILSNKCKESCILPLKELVIERDGEFIKKAEIKFEHIKVEFWGNYVDQGGCIVYRYYYNDIVSQYWNYGILPYNTTPPPGQPDTTPRGFWMASWGKNGLSDKFLFRSNPSTMSATGHIFGWRIYQPPRNRYLHFKMHAEYGTSPISLSKLPTYFNVKLQIRNGGNRYWNGGEWTSTQSTITVHPDENGDVTFFIDEFMPYLTDSLWIYLVIGDMLSDEYMYAFSGIEFGVGENEIATKVYPDPETKTTLSLDNGSKEESSVSQLFNVSIVNKNQVISPTLGEAATGMPTQYEYMFTSRQQHTLHTLIERSPLIYLQKVKYFTEYPRRKIISCGFEPSEDFMEVIMQGHSNF